MAEYVPYVPPAANQPASTGNSGPSLFGWHPSLPNLGGFKAVGQLAQGFLALPEIAYSALPGGPKSMLPQVASGIVGGLGGVASTVAAPIGIPGKWNVGENLIEPAVNSLDKAISGPETPPVQDFWQMSKNHGPIYGAINTVLNALPVTGPIAGTISGAADVADVAATAAKAADVATVAEGGAAADAAATAQGGIGASGAADAANAAAATKLEIMGKGFHPFRMAGAQGAAADLADISSVGPDAAGYTEQVQAMADALRAKATIAHALVHPFGAIAHGFAEQTAASFAELHPFETTTPTPEPTPSELAMKDVNYPASGYLTQEQVDAARSAARAMQSPEQASAEVMSGDTSVPRGQRLKPLAVFDEESKTASGIDPAERAQQRAELVQAHEDAKANIDQPGTGDGSIMQKTEERISQPPAAWAVRMAERLPDSINQILGQMNGAVDKFRINTVRRSLESWVEVAQRQVQHSTAVQLSVAAGTFLKDSLAEAGVKVTDFKVSQILGEELNGRMRGNQWIAEMLRTDGDPALVEAMRKAAKRGYEGLDPYLQHLGPEAITHLNTMIDAAKDEWTSAMAQRMETLLASRPGATGLEAAVLGLDQPPMGASQIKEYRKARMLLRMKATLEARMADPEYTDPRFARDYNPLQLASDKAHAEAEAAREQSGVLQKNMEDLRTAPPRASKPEVVARLAAQLRDELDPANPEATGGITFDPGTGAVGFSEGATQVVGLAEQGVYDVNQLLVPGEAERAIEDAVNNPVGHNGEVLPPGIWGGNVKLGFWNDGGKVYVDLSMDSHYDGTPLSPLEADLLGMAHEQIATFDGRNFESRYISQAPSDQNLWMHYISDIMDRKSPLSKYLQAQTKAEAGSTLLTEGDSVKAATTYGTWDYAVAKSNPDSDYKLGDIWKRISFDEKGVRSLDDTQLLKQTVLRMLPGTEADSIENMNVEQLHTALRWYYDSHDYIEGTYRGKQITLLNGETRDAAEVFYDLIAVTSVQASPTQNFGRALVGLANMEDFLQSRYTAMSSAQELMDYLEKKPAGTTNIVGPYWEYGVGEAPNPATGEEERLAGPGDKRYTKLSNRFLTPEVRNLTSGTNMTNDAKYKVMDVMTGKLKLDSATAGDLQHNAEWWSSDKSASADSMDRGQVVKELDRNDVHTPQAEAYRAWSQERNRVKAINDEMNAANRDKMARYTPGETFKSHPEWVQEWGSKSAFDKYRKSVLADEEQFLTDPEIADAHDQALMEHQGSSMLAKLRSFRSNLSAPEQSLAVTLDSVMGRLWGFNSQQWDKVGFYARYADKIRGIAQELSERWGREVKPHEVQAALWVHAKMEIGRQDWGRLLAHHDMAMDQIDAWEKGAPVAPRTVNGESIAPEDLLNEYRNEEIGYSQEAQVTRSERKFLTDKKNADMLDPDAAEQGDQMKYDQDYYKVLNGKVAKGELTPQTDPEQWAEYEDLRSRVGEGKTSQVTTAANREDISQPGSEPTKTETRYEIAYDANKLKGQLARFEGKPEENGAGGYNAVKARIKTALDAGDFAKAREELTAWVIQQRDAVMGQGGGSFGVVAEGQFIKNELGLDRQVPSATATGAARLNEAENVPAPNDMSGSRFRPQALDELLKNGQITQAQYDTKLAEWKGKLEGEEPQLNQTAPRDAGHPDPGMTRVYRGSDYPEPQGAQGLWWTDHEPHGRGGYAHWQQTDMPADMVDRLKSQVLTDRDRLDPAGTPVVGRDLILDPAEPAHQNAMDRALAYMHDTIDHGDMATLHQSFEEEVRGALLDHPTNDGHLVMRLFKNAAFDTLLHEGAHLLRRILPSDMLKEIERAYPHILDEDVAATLGETATANSARVAAEEKFVADMMSWIRAKTHGNWAEGGLSGELPEQAGAGAGSTVGEALARSVSMENVYGQVAAVLEDQVLQQVGSPIGPQHFDINNFWTRMFFPEIDKPDVLHDPIAAGIPTPRGVEVRKFPYETEQQFAQRSRQYGQSRERLASQNVLADNLEKRAVKADTAAKKMFATITTTPSELQERATALGVKADNILDRLAQEMETPDGTKVPMQWRPLWQAVVDMKEEAKLDTTGRLAEIMADVPQTFSAVLREAAERGFDPTFLPDMTWEMANRNLFGHIRIGAGAQALDSTRKLNTGVLHNAGIANQTIEQLGAGLVAATKELYTNTLIDHIEQFYAKPLAAGAAIPDGWSPWSAEREYIMTGTRPSGEIAATHANMIVPEHVSKALDSMSKEYDHWTFHTLTKANSVWRTWQLTLSPRYYVHIFVANMVRALSAGAVPKDFIETIRSWKAGTLPDELVGLDMQSAYRSLTNEDMPKRSMPSVFRPGPDSMTDVSHFRENISEADTKTQKVRAAVESTKQSLEKAHANLDKFSRAVVYEKMLRTGAGREAALQASIEAMGDYGALSPFERGVVRAVMPFYPYYKGLAKLLIRFPADHPGAAMVLMQAGKIHQEYMESLLGGSAPDNLDTTFNIFGFHQSQILNPFITGGLALEPRNLANAISPFVGLMLRTAYNAPTKGTTTKGMGPTGETALYDPLKGALQTATSAPPVLALAGALGNDNAYGQNPGLQTAVAKYLGVPQPTDVGAAQQNLYPTPEQTADKKQATVAKAKATRAAKKLTAGPTIRAKKGGWSKKQQAKITTHLARKTHRKVRPF